MSKYIKLEDAIEAVTSVFRVSALFGGINDDENMWREKAEKVFAKCEVVTDTAEQEPCIDCPWRQQGIDRIYSRATKESDTE